MTAADSAFRLGIDVVVAGVAGNSPLVYVLAGERTALPSGPFVPALDRTLELAARRVLDEQVNVEYGYLEQLYTFGDRHRDPREVTGGPRFVSVGYLALTGAGATLVADASPWTDWYRYLPWEDARRGRPRILDEEILPLLRARPSRRSRLAFGLDGAPWNNDSVLERYECLYEIGAVAESPGASAALGVPMQLDHRRILATAIGRLRGKLKYRPVVFDLIGPTFTLSELQGTVQALSGTQVHGPNFRRLLAETAVVERTGDYRPTSGRPAELYRFRADALVERADPGIAVR